jgi:hypothetical protein
MKQQWEPLPDGKDVILEINAEFDRIDELKKATIGKAMAEWKQWTEDNQPTLKDTLSKIYDAAYEAGQNDALREKS